MNAFKRYENGLIKDVDILDRNIIRPWKTLKVEKFKENASPDALATQLKEEFVKEEIAKWDADENRLDMIHLRPTLFSLIRETILEIQSKENISTRNQSHILHYWRDEASPELKEHVYDFFDLVEKTFDRTI